MDSRQRRLKKIELSLTPKQIVLVWLRNAQQAGSLEDATSSERPHRETVANRVCHAVRDSMKGQSEDLVERAILQARKEADFLYLLIVQTNIEVLESAMHQYREYWFVKTSLTLLDPLITKEEMEKLRWVVLSFAMPVVVLETAIERIVAEHFQGQPLLFGDCDDQLKQQLKNAEELISEFNKLAAAFGAEQMTFEQVRELHMPLADRRIESLVISARFQMLQLFGAEGECQSAVRAVLDQPRIRDTSLESFRDSISALMR